MLNVALSVTILSVKPILLHSAETGNVLFCEFFGGSLTFDVDCDAKKYAFNAPTVLMVLADKDVAWVAPDGECSGPVDAAIVITQMMLQAWDIGIGSCWVRGFDKNAMVKAFDIPDNLDLVALLPLGYPEAGSKPAGGWHDKRKPLDETVIYI